MIYTDDQLLELVRANKAGKEIQGRFKNGGQGYWYRFDNDPNWDFGTYDFRVAPEPKVRRKFMINLESNPSNPDGRKVGSAFRDPEVFIPTDQWIRVTEDEDQAYHPRTRKS